MFFSLTTGINRLISKGMLNVYLKVITEKNRRSQKFTKIKKLITNSIFAELHIVQISLSFKTSCCNLKIT